MSTYLHFHCRNYQEILRSLLGTRDETTVGDAGEESYT